MNFERALKIFGLKQNYSEKELKEKYRQLAKKYHPDHNMGDASANNKMKEINEAYDFLCKYKKRNGQNNSYQQNANNKETYDNELEELKRKYSKKIHEYEIKSGSHNLVKLTMRVEIIEFEKKIYFSICSFIRSITYVKDKNIVDTKFDNILKDIISIYNQLTAYLKDEITKEVNQIPFIHDKELKTVFDNFIR